MELRPRGEEWLFRNTKCVLSSVYVLSYFRDLKLLPWALTAIAKIQPRKQLTGQIYQVLDSVKSLWALIWLWKDFVCTSLQDWYKIRYAICSLHLFDSAKCTFQFHWWPSQRVWLADTRTQEGGQTYGRIHTYITTIFHIFFIYFT